MDHGAPTQKSDRDRIRQKRGAANKEIAKGARRAVKAWNDGGDGASLIAALAQVVKKADAS
ncbi:hypothetical protein [Rhizobium leguminosarum]|uniref:hypothetical protein n=1 Tax=Rhizobium leguminosarum TaxID=384 RepID=UPI000B92CFA1|nr:hypothetical protein [Rhizobium leguminosarum]ASS56863.1 hypothetical protein CHR56_21175 [Rhizobium leguminosarum bv. viciae]NEI89533.1 hypothetical protein [Rhizobium leguminosarum]